MPLDQNHPSKQISLLAPGIRCGSCITPIEKSLRNTPGVLAVRVNLTSRRIAVSFDPDLICEEHIVEILSEQGIAAQTPSAGAPDAHDATGRALLLRVGVAGFAAMNVMLLSISVWSGAEDAMRDLLHWVSALIALPAIAYAGQPFFRSAASALAARRLNMDVPISLAVILSAVHSLAETAQSAEHAYFDAGIMLLFFLLIGRYLEHRSRHLARSAAVELMALTGHSARLVSETGVRENTPLASVEIGAVIEVLPGERIPVDGLITRGRTDLDQALVTGESMPERAETGDAVHAGMLNLTGAIQIEVTAAGDTTLLAEIARMIDAAEHGRGRYDRIADRAAHIYAPMVHLLAAAAFLGWYFVSGDARLALQIAVAVLIVTCPCALALAVPTVHTITSARLFRQGIFLKDGTELERLAEIDIVAFDKTGTLTTGTPDLSSAPAPDDPAWPVAAALAEGSRHPCSHAIALEAKRLGISSAPVDSVREEPGLGVKGVWKGREVWLGRGDRDGERNTPGALLRLPDRTVAFQFSETLRPDALRCCDELRAKGLGLAVLSGDHPTTVTATARKVGIDAAQGGLLPNEKLNWLDQQRSDGRKVLMVGDGLNDSPALAGAHASISPGSAADVAKTAAGLVFTGTGLMPVSIAHSAAITARRRSLESFAIAIGYNAIAIPIALAGLVTPLVAAAAMSLSSILVILNACRKG